MDRGLQHHPYTAWQLLKAYWKSPYRVSAYVFLISVLIMSMILVAMDVVFTNWYNHFYNSLQDYNWRSCIDLLKVFVALAGFNIVIAVYRYYLQSFLGLRWRRWLTEEFLDRWLYKKNYYYLEEFTETTDNPDQRIQEDIAAIVTLSLNLLIGMLSAVVTIVAFIFVLWELSGIFTLNLGVFGTYKLPGYLVWVAIIYSLIGTYFTHRIGKPLVSLNFEQQRREANFRFSAIDLRSHAEHVALYEGENHQRTVLQSMLDSALNNFYAIILRQKLLLWFTAGYNQVSVILPLIVALPNYFNHVFKLGGLMQSLSAFGKIQDALSFIVNSYTTIAEWQAVMRRLLTFLNHIASIESDTVKNNKFEYATQDKNQISVKELSLLTPDNENLLKNFNYDFNHGSSYWIKGDSGIGKSTLTRALAGIWPYGKGKIIMPRDKKIMFVPQRSYMPIGTLQQALLFPNNIMWITEESLKQALLMCDLPNLTAKLHHVTVWSEHLSPGELQRIAFVRVLIHKPDWVVLDESTSALDLPHEKLMYDLLKERLPNCSVISVGHRPSLTHFHEHEVDLTAYRVERVVG